MAHVSNDTILVYPSQLAATNFVISDRTQRTEIKLMLEGNTSNLKPLEPVFLSVSLRPS